MWEGVEEGPCRLADTWAEEKEFLNSGFEMKS
jgi:hypothetical protein